MGETNAIDEDPRRAVRLAGLPEGGFGRRRVGDVAGDGQRLDRLANDADTHRIDVDGGDQRPRFG